MYYGLIILSVVMLSGCFGLKDTFRKIRGSGLYASMESTLIGAAAGLIVLLIINGLRFEVTPFTLIMASLCAVNGIAFAYLMLKSLDRINLSLFSVFSMLGGMVLPFLQGIIFYDEGITVAKIVCVLFICVALILTVKKGDGKKGYIFYLGVFVLNGMSGVLSKLFTELPYEKTSAAGYSIWSATFSILLSGAVMLILLISKRERLPAFSLKAFGSAASSGAVNKIANYILVLALLHVDASVQYPMVTGGVMIVSTLICFFGDRKPSKRELVSVLFAFLGMLALFVIPI